MKNVFDFSVKTPRGNEMSLEKYKGNVLLIVNTATKCGLTPQFTGLEELHQKYKEEGLVVLGFPSNQFMNQEPLSNDEMEEVCKVNHGVTFPLFSKIKVNGSDADPLYKHLKKEKKGILSSEIKWNFTKFLVNQEGEVVERFSPQTVPEKLEDDIVKLLNEKK
ncbi:glutathione peroxidase [Alkalihalobacillus alcalophilus ATCC 27647 = CGMCC 1.3604]|uniref:Glutathione peroxidase n=1 Tax=Alkalihalobacillus alcalophilus ATCC 27647 = CGMCC 1.3604 TaxID=1218173 RepID=A0A094WI62_ALKAL|nr:glutathione peroxidase [Alkalihalobacillus alcalophilus]KGA97479.1 glutathione peroxidase [Alkalihalobacillus alcalophilus ATCC 27647 = CGMCC 1.3604]MED1563278.1 glutathione peroxidase [Alkalihalobacillus alcalophilus]THG92235.1 glutathione peroxidase [Alkalihalobacillus alcalophilus ATCC 27647 = CGMCC 1.3604]